MHNTPPQNWNLPDFSRLSETVQKIHEMLRPVAETAQRLHAIMQPLAEAAAKYRPKIIATAATITEALLPLYVARKLGEAQFVCWDYMNKEFINAINKSSNTNKTLREFMVADKYHHVHATIEKCMANPLMSKHLRLFTQAINAFNRGDSDLAVNGLTSVFDGVLTDISENTTHKLAPRVNAIKQKLEHEDVLEHDEYATLTLALTLQKTLESFSKPAPFDKAEPKGLNRHWIAHGRSLRRKTKLDCVKLINLIYALLLLHELDTLAPSSSSTT